MRPTATLLAISALYRNDLENETETSDDASDTASESEDDVTEEDDNDDQEEEGRESELEDPPDIAGSPNLRCRNADMSWLTNPPWLAPASSQARSQNIF